MSPSSTSSSEPLALAPPADAERDVAAAATDATADQPSVRRARPRGLLVALGVLAAVECFVRTELPWAWETATPSGVVDGIEQKIIAKSPDPTVLILGSSRARDGILPRQLEQALHLPPGAALNLGITGGTPFDALTLYRRNRAKLRRAKLLVFAVEDWHMNARFPPGTLDRRFATLEERWHTFDGESTVSLVAGWVWRTYDAQEPLRNFAVSLIRGRRQLRVTDDLRISWRDKDLEQGPAHVAPERWLQRFYGDFELGRGRFDQLNQLLQLATSDGLQVLVVRLPWRDAYVNAVQARYASAFAQTTQLTRTLPAKLVLFERCSSLGIADQDYYDYGHLALRGARLMTDVLASRIREDFPSVLGDVAAQSTTGSPGGR